MVPQMRLEDYDELHNDLIEGRNALTTKFHGVPPVVLRAGEPLIKAAQSGSILYRLQAGWAYRFHDFPDGSRAIVDIYLPGDVIGIDMALCKKPIKNVRSLTTAVIEVIREESDLHALMKSRLIALYIAWLLIEQQRRADLLLGAISCLDARGRLATMLLDLHHRLGAQQSMATSGFNLPLTQQHIGSHLGLTVVHVNRVIRALRDERIANIEKHWVTLINLGALADLAKVDRKLGPATERI
jgi:CRP/FNR family transcriptional regulator, anaerobic regulatory protein